MESTVGQARERAVDTWDRLEKVFEDRVHKSLVKLGVPDRKDLLDLSRRVDTLTSELRRQGGKPAKSAAAPARKAPAKKAATKPAPRVAAARKPVAKKSSRRPKAPGAP
jgi:hypothetical protein